MRRKYEARLLDEEVKEDERKSKSKPLLERQSTADTSDFIAPQTPTTPSKPRNSSTSSATARSAASTPQP